MIICMNVQNLATSFWVIGSCYTNNMRRLARFGTFVQFKKREEHLWRNDIFSKVADWRHISHFKLKHLLGEAMHWIHNSEKMTKVLTKTVNFIINLRFYWKWNNFIIKLYFWVFSLSSIKTFDAKGGFLKYPYAKKRMPNAFSEQWKCPTHVMRNAESICGKYFM